MPLISVGEVSTGLVFGSGIFSVRLNVSDEMILEISKPPIMEKFHNRNFNKAGNYYCFGPFLDGESYNYAGSIGNDVAQVGVVLLDGITKEEENKITNRKWSNLFIYKQNRRKLMKPWDNRKLLNEIRVNVSARILFLGETVGGDVGCAVLVHYIDGTKEIDSIILDNNVFMKR